MLTRVQTLADLLPLRRPIDELVTELRQFPWDSKTTLIELRSRDMVGVLRRFLDGDITAGQLEEWANAIESREDIGFEQSSFGPLEDAISELANPAISDETITAIACRWLSALTPS